MSDKILLHGVRLTVHLGVPEPERARPQEVLVDLEAGYDTRQAGASDDFSDTVDYSAIHDTLRRVAGWRPYALVESLAERMAEAVLAEFPVQSVRIKLKKPAALRSRGVDYAGVEIYRERHDPQAP